MDKLDYRCEKILFTNKQIVDACKKASKWIDEKYKNKQLVIVGILNGCVPFLAELIKHITIDFKLRFVEYHSYYGGVASVRKKDIVSNLNVDVAGQHVILVDDVIDTGWTMSNLKNTLLLENGAKSVEIMCLVDKPSQHEISFGDYYKCFSIDNEFIIGFGLDYQENLRGLPYIGVLKKSIFEKELKKVKAKNQKQR